MVKPSDLAKQAEAPQQSETTEAPQHDTAEQPDGIPGATGTPLDGELTQKATNEAKDNADSKPPWGSDEDFDPERAWNLIQKLRADNTKAKEKLAPLEQAAEEARQAQMTEIEKANEERNRSSLAADVWREQAIRSTAEAMVKGRFIDDDAALSLIGDLNVFADEGRVNTKKLQAKLDKLAEDKPHLVARAGLQPNRGQGGSVSGPITPQQIARQAESQQDWRGAASAKAQMLRELREAQK